STRIDRWRRRKSSAEAEDLTVPHRDHQQEPGEYTDRRGVGRIGQVREVGIRRFVDRAGVGPDPGEVEPDGSRPARPVDRSSELRERVEPGAARPGRKREWAPGGQYGVHADVLAEDGPRVAGRPARCGVRWALPNSRVEELVRLPELPAEQRGR